jgi:hypothetical protein
MKLRTPIIIALSAVSIFGQSSNQPVSLLEDLRANRNIVEPQIAGTPLYVQSGRKDPVPMEMHTVRAKVSRGMATIEVAGDHSSFQIGETMPYMVVKLAAAPRPDRDMIIRLDSVNAKRTALLSIRPGGLTQPLPGKQAEIIFSKIGKSSYLVRPAAPLAPGEYCLTFGVSNDAFFFGIEPGAKDNEVEKPSTSDAVHTGDGATDKRLSTLATLLSQGLIGKADYDAKRAEILNPPALVPPTLEDRLRKLDDLLKQGSDCKAGIRKKAGGTLELAIGKIHMLAWRSSVAEFHGPADTEQRHDKIREALSPVLHSFLLGFFGRNAHDHRGKQRKQE